MLIKTNVFYVASEKTVYICWEKLNNVKGYKVIRDNEEIANSIDNEFVRPYEFDNDHHTELFKPATRNWLYYKDHNVEDLRHYSYRVESEGGTLASISADTRVYTE